MNTSRFVRCGLVILIATIAPLIGGCEEKKPIQPPADLPLGAKSAQLIDVYVGRTHLRIPWNMIGHTYQSGFRQGKPRKTDGIAVIVYWPEMISQVEAPGARGLDSLYIQIRGFEEPQPFPWQKDPEAHFREYTKRLDGPIYNAQIALREWRLREIGQAVVFARSDATYRTPEGRIPSASCPRNGPADRLVECNSGGTVNPYLWYQYRFYKPSIANWPAMDDAVRSLVSSFVVNAG